jgi:hypothetical protein
VAPAEPLALLPPANAPEPPAAALVPADPLAPPPLVVPADPLEPPTTFAPADPPDPGCSVAVESSALPLEHAARVSAAQIRAVRAIILPCGPTAEKLVTPSSILRKGLQLNPFERDWLVSAGGLCVRGSFAKLIQEVGGGVLNGILHVRTGRAAGETARFPCVGCLARVVWVASSKT